MVDSVSGEYVCVCYSQVFSGDEVAGLGVLRIRRMKSSTKGKELHPGDVL